MPNTRVPAAATGLPEIDRRAALAGSVALLATAATGVLGGIAQASTAPMRTPLAALMEAHRRAYEGFEHAVGVRNSIEDELEEDWRKNPVLVPLAVMPNGKCQSGYLQLGSVSSNEIRDSIRNTHDSLRKLHCSKWSRVMFPELAAAAERELEASQARALRALADAEARVEAHERSAGLTVAVEAVIASEKEEFEARLSLAVYMPRDTAEAAVKRDYIETSPPFRDGWCSDNNEFVNAMIARIGEPASAGWREA